MVRNKALALRYDLEQSFEHLNKGASLNAKGGLQGTRPWEHGEPVTKNSLAAECHCDAMRLNLNDMKKYLRYT